MTLENIANIRLISQQIAISRFTSAKDLVAWMGAMQAQDFPMVKMAIGLRVPGSTEQTINKTIDGGEIIRTHLLRPTWHLVAAEDVYWMLELTAPQIRTILRTRHKHLGLNDLIIEKCYTIIKEVLRINKFPGREDLAKPLATIGITNVDNALAHILLLAETDGLICSGPTKRNQQTYALLEERVKKPENISKDKALEKLALRYFQSRGPATLQDFKWWSGLNLKDARIGLESVKSKLVQINSGSDAYWMDSSIGSAIDLKPSVYLLPSYDEFLISYNDRSAALSEIHNKKAISVNGIFRPVIVYDGKVIGLWKKSVVKEEIIIECQLFKAAGKAIKRGIELQVENIGRFIGKKVRLRHI